MAENVRDCGSAVVEGLDEFEGDDEDNGGDIVSDEEYSSMVQELQDMDNVVFTLDKADDDALN